MKKAIGIIILGLFWCNFSFSAEKIETFELWCVSYERFINGKKENYEEEYHIKITDDQAYFLGLENLFHSLFRDKDTDPTNYSFSNIGINNYNSSVDPDGNVIPFNALSINRRTGKASATIFILKPEIYYMNCSKDVPELKF